MKNIGCLLCLAIIVAFAQCQDGYTKVIHNFDPEAKCLDGSPSSLYVNEGDPKKILVFFLGGGICGEVTMEKTLQSCYQRSKDFLGTSTLWPDFLPGNLLQGYLSLDPSINAFAGWTKFFLPYCDGSLHQGFASDPIKYKDTNLYFRGGAITRGHLNWIDSKYNLKGADKIVLTGMSAGGIAVNIWNNYVKTFVGDQNKVYTISDSGVFLNFPSMAGEKTVEKQMQNIFKLANADEITPLKQCNQKYPGEEWRCFFIQEAFTSISGKFLILNSEYDSWAIPQIMHIQCLKNGTSGMTLSGCSKDEMTYIESYRTSYKTVLADFADFNQELSIWSIACSNHVYAYFNAFYDSPKQKVPAESGKTVREVVELFVLSEERTIILDPAGWPSNTGCAF